MAGRCCSVLREAGANRLFPEQAIDLAKKFVLICSMIACSLELEFLISSSSLFSTTKLYSSLYATALKSGSVARVRTIRGLSQ
jgi:hypothetical protein